MGACERICEFHDVRGYRLRSAHCFIPDYKPSRASCATRCEAPRDANVLPEEKYCKRFGKVKNYS